MWKVVLPVLAAVFAVGFGSLVGGITEIDVNEPGARNAANFAVNHYNNRYNDEYTREVVRVVKAQRQLVSGFKYVITVEMNTRCKIGGCVSPQGSESAQTYTCTFTVWDVPWLNKITVLSETCDGQNNERKDI